MRENSKVTNLLVTEDMNIHCRVMAAYRGMTRAEYIRNLIRQDMQDHPINIQKTK